MRPYFPTAYVGVHKDGHFVSVGEYSEDGRALEQSQLKGCCDVLR